MWGFPVDSSTRGFKEVEVAVCPHGLMCLLCHFHFRDSKQVAVVYFRNGYMPDNYTSEQVQLLICTQNDYIKEFS